MTHDRPLVVVRDEALLEEILKLAAAVGCVPQRALDVGFARTQVMQAPLVLIDDRAIEENLPRRPGIVLVTEGPPTGELSAHAFEAGVEKVVSLPDDEQTLLIALADVAEGPPLPGGCVVGVIGGRGGAGATVLAAAIGIIAGKCGEALLVDCDPLGGGVDYLLGAEADPGLRWPGIHADGGRISMPALVDALPEHRQRGSRLPFVSCARDGHRPGPKAIASVVEAGRRAGSVVVCDLPRHLGPEAEAVLLRADLVVVVVPAEQRACAAANRVVDAIVPRTSRVRLVVRGPAPGGLAPDEVAGSVGAPLLTSMAPQRHLDKALEHTQFDLRPRGPLARTARLVLAEARAAVSFSQSGVAA